MAPFFPGIRWGTLGRVWSTREKLPAEMLGVPCLAIPEEQKRERESSEG